MNYWLKFCNMLQELSLINFWLIFKWPGHLNYVRFSRSIQYTESCWELCKRLKFFTGSQESTPCRFLQICRWSGNNSVRFSRNGHSPDSWHLYKVIKIVWRSSVVNWLQPVTFSTNSHTPHSYCHFHALFEFPKVLRTHDRRGIMWQEIGGNCIMRSFITCTSRQT
jgi:hypothetical protein